MRNQQGFTLIEVLIVLTVVGILAAGFSPNMFQVIAQGQALRTVQDIEIISTALLAFHKDTGLFPRNDLNGDRASPGESGLLFNPGGLRGWNGPYLNKEIKGDAFGGPISLERDLNLIDFTANGGNDLVVAFGSVPFLVALLVDFLLDDGNTACTGFGPGGRFASGRICFDDSAVTSPGLRVVVAPDRA